jgi:hypothetical protein
VRDRCFISFLVSVLRSASFNPKRFVDATHDRSPIHHEDTVREALCFGWIDSLIKRLDDDRYALKVTPRQPTSKWSDINRKRWAQLKAAGLLTSAGYSTGTAASAIRRSGSNWVVTFPVVAAMGEAASLLTRPATSLTGLGFCEE